MSWIQKGLITLGIFWLSQRLIPLVGWPLSKLTSRITYTDTVLNALALGFMNSLDRTICAAIAGLILAAVIKDRMSLFWALVLGVLFLLYAPHFRWFIPETAWDRLWQGVSVVFPAVACIGVAFTKTYLRTNGRGPEKV
jgi:hypothetical protein